MMAQETMDIFAGRPLKVYLATNSAKQIFFSTNMIGAYVSMVPDFRCVPPREDPTSTRQKMALA